jgi:hypothetical protein
VTPRKLAFLVGLEHYQHSRIPAVKYAADDARAMSSALAAVGYDLSDQEVFIDSQATKATLESHLQEFLNDAEKNDTVVVFFAGHGLSLGGENYLTCHDTRIEDVAKTCLRLQSAFRDLDSCRAGKRMMFLDACHTGLPIDVSMRDVQSHLTEKQLKEFFAEAKHTVCFAACEAEQKSYSSDHLRHGIWTYHIVEALRGDAQEALVRRRFVTSSSLQNYVAGEVPKSLRRASSGRRVQRPVVFGRLDREFEVVDLQELIDKKRAAKAAEAGGLKDAAICGEETLSISGLSGFNKKRGHFVPDEANANADAFVRRIAEKEVSEELEEVRIGAKRAFGYKRRDVNAGSDSGAGSVLTPDFCYSVEIAQDESDPSDAILTRTISEIRDPSILQSDEFQELFGNWFDQVELSLEGEVDVEDIIDRVEADDASGLECEYPEDCSRCTIEPEEGDWHIVVQPRSLTVCFDRRSRPRDLLLRYRGAVKTLLTSPVLHALLPGGTTGSE